MVGQYESINVPGRSVSKVLCIPSKQSKPLTFWRFGQIEHGQDSRGADLYILGAFWRERNVRLDADSFQGYMLIQTLIESVMAGTGSAEMGVQRKETAVLLYENMNGS